MRWLLVTSLATVAALVAIPGSPATARADVAEKSATAAAYLPLDAGSAERLGYYVDPTGRKLLFHPVYHQWFGKPRKRYYLRAGIEQVGILAAELGYYWLKADSNKNDWDYPNFKERFLDFQAVRFDNNLSITNFVIHPLAGTMYYSFARNNGLSIYESLGVSAFSSALYEWWLEWLEKVSINDLIFTPMGGWAPGEFLFKLESYFNSAPGGGAWGQRALQYTLGSPVYLHGLADQVKAAPPVPADNLGFSSAYWHQFDLAYGYSAVDNDRGESTMVSDIDVEAKLYAMPGFLKQGRFQTGFGDGNFSDVEMRMTLSGDGWADLDVWFSNDFAGLYTQDLEATRDGLVGHALLVGGNSAIRYARRWLFDRTDMLALAHLIGPRVRYWLVDGEFHAELGAVVHGDFVGIEALPYPEWTVLFGATGTKTELQNHRYYFGYGTSGRFDARIGYGGADLATRLEVGVYDSIEGWDREQPMVTKDIHNKDQFVQIGASFGYTIPRAPIHFGVEAGETLRRSQMPPLVVKRWDRRLALRLGIRF